MKELYQVSPLPGEANCASTDPELFFREYGTIGRDKYAESNLKMARKVCNNCQIFDWCHEDAVANPDSHMIRAGLTPTAQKRLHKERYGR